VVEKGIQGMRSLTDEEEALLEFSRAKKIQAQKERKRNRVIRGVLVSVVAVFAALAGWQWKVAYQQYLYSRAGELAFTARAILKKDNTLALNVASTAYSVLGLNSPPMVMQTLSDIYYTQEDMPLYASNYPHTETVFSAVFSPDGQNVLTASEDGFAKLWDIRGKELRSFPHVIEVKDAIFSPNGKQILTMTRLHIYLWERDGTLIDQDSIPETVYNLEEFSTDGMKIIPKYNESENSHYFSNVDSIKQGYSVVVSSPIHHRIIGLNYDHWSLYDEQGNIIRDSIPAQVYHASFSRDGKQFLTVTPDSIASRITVWSEAGDSLYSFKCNGVEVKAVFSPDGKGFLTASNDFTAKLWDFSNPFLHRFPKQTAAMSTVDYFPDGTRYLTASYDSTAKIFDETGKQIGSLKHRGAVLSAFFSPDGNRVITACRDSTARLWSPKEYKVIELLHRGRVECAIFSADGKLVLTASQDSLARLWSLEGVMIDSFHHNSDVSWAGFSPDSKRILTISKDDAVTLWDIEGNDLHVFQHPERVNSASFSNDGAYLLTSCNDSIVRQFSLAGDSIHAEKHSEKPKIALFSADGRYILTGGKTIHIWSPKWILKASLIHAENVSSVTISPDGRQILTTSFDRNAYLWNFKGDNLAIYRKHSEKINTGIFIRDGSHVLTASDDGYILRWRTPQAIFEGLKTRIIYQLTKKEEEQYSIIW
jgi:WD40 repeat protein